jgi:DNA-binding transcriptional ArsR family regulator
MDQRPTIHLRDPRAMRALAHPLRLRLLGLLRHEGPGTASSLAAEVDEAPSLVSYHLRQLAEHGFLEEAPELSRDARERWWRAAHLSTRWSSVEFLDDPERRSADLALRREVYRLYAQRLSEYLDEEPSWDREWVGAAGSGDELLRLTPARLRELGAELEALLARYRDDPGEGDVQRVQVIYHAFPRR